MSQNNNGYQDLIINNGVISTVSNLGASDNSALQGIQMNQFAICANPGSAPVLVPYITPMLLSPHNAKTEQPYQFKYSIDKNLDFLWKVNGMSINGNNQDNRSQNGQIQLANNITIPSNLINSGNLPLGLSYINLSSLTSQAGGTAIPIQLALNTGSNQQFTLPLASITQLTNDLQISNAYTLAPQIKFEPEVITHDQLNQISGQNFQKTSVKCEDENPSTEMSTTKRTRKKVMVRKAGPYPKRPKLDTIEPEPEPKSTPLNSDSDLLYDHKGRPFMYPCNQCSKKFTQNSRLTAHLRCHSGIRPYTCTQCGFSFTQKSYLIRHAAVHKEDRPFTCAKCLKNYKHYGSLANHRKLHCRESINNGAANGNAEPDDLDETIQQTIESVQLNHHHNQQQQQHHQNNYILTYTPSATSDQRPLVYFNHSQAANQNAGNMGSANQTQATTLGDLQLPGSGPVVFPSQELPSISAVSLLPTNRSAINELKAITTHLATNVDVDAVPASAPSCLAKGHFQQQQQQQHHIKQEPTAYFAVTQQQHPGRASEDPGH